MSKPLIQLQNVHVQHADSGEVLLRDVTWPIGRGEFWLVRGDQGSGKTDLIQTAAGLQAPADGRVTIDDCELTTATEEENLALRRRVGFVFEHGGRLLNHLTVAGNIALPLLYHCGLSGEEAFDRAHGLLEGAGLGANAGLLPSRLSPVIQQRVSYLRAVADPREVLFVDHPIGPYWWGEQLGRLKEQSVAEDRPITVVVSSVQDRAWDELVDHVAVVEGGGVKLETRD